VHVTIDADAVFFQALPAAVLIDDLSQPVHGLLPKRLGVRLT
jgi:hypothetical protein